MEWYVYILLTKNSHYYIWSTRDVKQRLAQHKKWDVVTTKRLAPVKLIFTRKYHTIQCARKIENWLKKQKSKKIVEKFMSPIWEDPIESL